MVMNPRVESKKSRKKQIQDYESLMLHSLLQVVLEGVKQVPKHQASEGIWSTRVWHIYIYQ